MNNVERIKDEKRCMSCGACSCVCPANAIDMIYNDREGFYRPSIDKNKCVSCRKCISVCPSENQHESSFMGEFSEIYLAHATDANVRHLATSGGVINALVRYLLDKSIVEAVLMTGYSVDSPVEAQPFLITRANVSILLNNPRDFASRYVTVPILDKIKEVKQLKSIAVVGTSCQTTALKLFGGGIHNLNIFRIGITCSGGISYKATTEYKRVRNLESAKMFYRGDGWPGRNSLVTDVLCVSTEHIGSLFERMFTSQIFKNPGCRYCKDHFAENADISFCDFWNKDELATEQEGNSCVIIRSSKAKEILHAMQVDNYIEIVRLLTDSEVESGQMHVLKAKKGGINSLQSYKVFSRLIEFVFNHKIYRLFGVKTYQLFCRMYYKIISYIHFSS